MTTRPTKWVVWIKNFWLERTRAILRFSFCCLYSLGEDEDSDAPLDASTRDSEDEAEWDRLQADVKSRDAVLDPKSKESHTVHAPYFPEVTTNF